MKFLRDLKKSLFRSRQRSSSFLHQADTIASISLKNLKSEGIRGIVLDLDNTIISEDDRYLSPGAEIWIQQAKQEGLQFFLLSNGKRRYRVKFWSQRLGIQAFSPARKPLPKGFRKAFDAMQLPRTQVVVIGDGFHTDGLGAWGAGCPFIQVASLPHPSRWWEKLVGQWIQVPYPKHLELWTFDSQSFKIR